MACDELADFIRKAAAEGERLNRDTPRPIAAVTIHREGKSLDVCLDTSESSYGEWIRGEGGDITIQRSQETKKVTGAHLPLYAKTLMVCGEGETIRIDVATGELSIVHDGEWRPAMLVPKP